MPASTFRIGAIGDFHGDHKLAAFELFMAEAQPDALVGVGDLQYYAAMPVPFVWVRGNHEDWDTIAALERGQVRLPNHQYLADGRRANLGGLSIMGIGGNWSPNGKQAPKYIRHEYLASIRREYADIVLSHETPLRFQNRPELALEPLCELVPQLRPRFWFSGHHHYFETATVGRTTLVSLGKWPHEWALLDVDKSNLRLSRFVPSDLDSYNAALGDWRLDEAAQKTELLGLERRGKRR